MINFGQDENGVFRRLRDGRALRVNERWHNTLLTLSRSVEDPGCSRIPGVHTSMNNIAFDPRCLELAEYFLNAEPAERNTEENKRDLARNIQAAVEWFLTQLDRKQVT